MSRKCKTYYVKSLDKNLTIKELEKISGIKSSVIYDRIHKLGWDIEKAISQPKMSVKNNNAKNNNLNSINYVDNFINKNTTSFCNLDYILFDKTGIPAIIKFIDVKDNNVTPFESHPYRYPTAWFMFTLLTKFAKTLGGYLYIINYNSEDDSEYRVLKVTNYNKSKISQHLNRNLPYCEYLDIEEDLCLNKQEFNEWISELNTINKNIKNKQYKILRSKNSNITYNKPSYYKDPIKSKDHLGNTFYSFNSMCKAYNMNETTVRERLKRGWSIERALTETPNKKNRRA